MGNLCQDFGSWKARDFTSWSMWKGKKNCHLSLIWKIIYYEWNKWNETNTPELICLRSSEHVSVYIFVFGFGFVVVNHTLTTWIVIHSLKAVFNQGKFKMYCCVAVFTRACEALCLLSVNWYWVIKSAPGCDIHIHWMWLWNKTGSRVVITSAERSLTSERPKHIDGLKVMLHGAYVFRAYPP